jgi:hypothetical protein
VLRGAHKFDFTLVTNKETKFGDRWKASHAVVHNEVFDVKVCMPKCLAATVVESVKSLYQRCEGQLHYLE